MSEHQTDLLGAYVLGVLEPGEEMGVQRHLDTCEMCRREVGELREMEAALGELPPEAFIEGPPDGADLLLQRTLREMRAETSRENRVRRVLWAAAAVVVVAGVLVGGTVLGRGTAPTGTVAQPAPSASEVPGTRHLTGSGPTGTTMAVAVIPAAGWVRLAASVFEIPAGQKCELVVVAKDGTERVAGSWLVSPAGEANGTMLTGSALVPVDQVSKVLVRNLTGQTFVSVAA
jgi:RNA polymerase sigma-70 factor (ECF subfamily)